MSKQKTRSPRQRIESVFLALGVVLLLAYFSLRGLGDYQALANISAFEQAVASELALNAADSATPKTGGTRYSPEPGYKFWSAKRIADYHEGNAIRDEAPLAILSIDKLDLKVPVYNGTDEINLNRGAGRIKGTAWIDTPGNLGIAGHRDGFFRVLKDIELGDSIQMLTFNGQTEFVVSSITIVDPSDVSVLAATDDSTITLVTCYPFYFVGHAPKRYIVKGELVSNQVKS